MEFGFYSFGESFKSGFDFYTGDETDVFIGIFITSNAEVSLTKITFASIAIVNTSNIQVNSHKIVSAQANIICDGATLTLGTKIKLADCQINVQSELSVISQKISSGAASLSADSNILSSITKISIANIAIDNSSNIVVISTKIAKALASITPTSNVAVLGTLIKYASATISSSANLSVVGDIVLITAKINNLFGNTQITVQAVRFSNSITADSALIRTLLMLDGIPLTNQNRQFDISVTPIFVENINWQGDASRYYKNTSANSGGKRTFNLQWRFIPNYENKTVDLRASRNYINKKSKDADVHTLTILKQDETGTTPYTEENVDVLITNYSENLIRRDLVDDVYYFDCSMSLEEV
ncbi:hypothetical protein EB001_00015 [bacterium]|nr:hypothetical protein [bacterium]